LDKKFKIFVIAAIVFLGIAIAVSTFFILNIVGKDKETAVSEKKEKSKISLTTVDLGDAITTNIFDEEDEQHIARVVISFAVNEKDKSYKAFQEAFASKNVVIRDEIIHIIREQTYEMMSKADAQTKLGDEIVMRINKLLDTQVIQDVYFGDFFVQ
jgi:flagellar basal body-associated protein FliL